MRRLSFLTSLLAAAALCAPAAHAADAVYKCRIDGKLSYSDRPCPEGQGQALPPPSAGIPVGDTAGVATGDSRTLLDLEKVRTERARCLSAIFWPRRITAGLVNPNSIISRSM